MKSKQFLVQSMVFFYTLLSLNLLNAFIYKKFDERHFKAHQHKPIGKISYKKYKKLFFKPYLKFLHPYFNEILQNDVCHGGDHLITILKQHVQDLQKLYRNYTFRSQEGTDALEQWAKKVKEDYYLLEKEQTIAFDTDLNELKPILPLIYRGRIVRTIDFSLTLGFCFLFGVGTKVGQAIMFSGKRALVVFMVAKGGGGIGALASVGYSEHFYSNHKNIFPHSYVQSFAALLIGENYSLPNNLPKSERTKFPEPILSLDSPLPGFYHLEDALVFDKNKCSGLDLGIGLGAGTGSSSEIGAKIISLPPDDLLFMHHLGLE